MIVDETGRRDPRNDTIIILDLAYILDLYLRETNSHMLSGHSKIFRVSHD